MSLFKSQGSKIIFCATGIKSAVGGIASANTNVLAALEAVSQAQGLELQALTLNENESEEKNYRAFGGRKLSFILALLTGMFRTRMMVFDHVRLALPILLIPKFLRPSIIIFAHGSESCRRMRRTSMWLYRAADLVITNSDYTLKRMHGRFSGFNAVACPLGLPAQFAMTKSAVQEFNAGMSLDAVDAVSQELGDRILLLVARMDTTEREKGHRELLAVFPKLVQEFPECQLVFVGSGSDLPELVSIARALPCASRIFIPGRVSSEQLEMLYKKSFAYVMPSRQEGFGLAHLEAMNYAKPCLACHDDGAAEVVADGVTGLLVNQPIDLEELEKAIALLLANPEKAKAYGEAGWKRLSEKFTAEAYQQRLKKHILGVLG
ncbi:MAG: glycosyltransferase family 4 protein [Arenimonas sp.]